MTSSSRYIDSIPEMVRAQKRGHSLGLYCICSANQSVLEAAMLQANQDGTAVCIESTPNQVNQFGGYSGKTPAEFVQFVHTVARDMRFPAERIIVGGDHLGPHVWQNEASASCTDQSRVSSAHGTPPNSLAIVEAAPNCCTPRTLPTSSRQH